MQKITIKLPIKIKNKWVKALRSGKYKQGVGKLKILDGSYEGFCCLGVLHDCTGGEWDGRNIKGTKIDDCLTRSRKPPKEIKMALGQYYNDYMTVEKFLISKNDGEGEWGETPKWSFKKIANWIEKNL